MKVYIQSIINYLIEFDMNYTKHSEEQLGNSVS